jgi:hypothetical protein
MTRTKIRLDTLSDIHRFVAAMGKIDAKIWLEDGEGNRVSARSLLGCIYSMEWVQIYCYCDQDISSHLMLWAV